MLSGPRVSTMRASQTCLHLALSHHLCRSKKKVPRESPGLAWEECLGSKHLGCPVIMLAIITGLNTVTAELRH